MLILEKIPQFVHCCQGNSLDIEAEGFIGRLLLIELKAHHSLLHHKLLIPSGIGHAVLLHESGEKVIETDRFFLWRWSVLLLTVFCENPNKPVLADYILCGILIVTLAYIFTKIVNLIREFLPFSQRHYHLGLKVFCLRIPLFRGDHQECLL